MNKIITILFIVWGINAEAQNWLSDLEIAYSGNPAELEKCSTLCIDSKGNKWLGYENAGLLMHNGTQWIEYNATNGALPNNNVHTIYEDPSTGYIWVGTFNGLSYFNGTTWTVVGAGINNNAVYSFARLNNELYLGTSAGICVYNGNSFTFLTSLNSNLFITGTISGICAGNNELWVGTNSGLYKIIKAGSSYNVTLYNTLNSSITSNTIHSLLFYNNYVWIGTDYETCRYNYTNSTFEIIPSAINSYEKIKRIFSIAASPNGGIIAFNNFFASNNFYEINNSNEVYKYTLYGDRPGDLLISSYTSNANKHSLALDITKNEFWILGDIKKKSNNKNVLLKFDFSKYDRPTSTSNFNLLDINQVIAPIINKGYVFENSKGYIYEVPAGNKTSTSYTNGLWIGGYDKTKQLHQASAFYSSQLPNDYWPGTLDTANATTDTTAYIQYDHIWKIIRFKIEEFKYYFANGSVQNGSYLPDKDILTWPAHGNGSHARNLAPFIDVNGNGVYDPLTGGDYPNIKGDQQLYWIYNDNLYQHNSSVGGLPLGVEIHASAYAYTCPTIVDSLKVLNYTTFYDYIIINRSNNDYDSTCIGVFSDPDLGGWSDDYIGCIPEINTGFTYNAKYYDGSNSGNTIPGTFGKNPPISSNVILNGPVAIPGDGIDNNNNGIIDEPNEKCLLNSFNTFNNDSDPVLGNPSIAPDFYHLSRGRDKSGIIRKDCKNNSTTFLYKGIPNDPQSCSEIMLTNSPFDRRYIQGIGPFYLPKKDSVHLTYAIVYSRDTNNAWNSTADYQNMINDIRRVTQWYQNNNFPSCLKLNVSVQESNMHDYHLLLHPNPTENTLYVTVDYTPRQSRYSIYTILGVPVLNGTFSDNNMQIDVSVLPNGVYFFTFEDGAFNITKRFIKNN